MDNTAQQIFAACSKCKSKNDSGLRFCTGCGASLWLQCPKCEKSVRPSDQYCGGCGFDLAGYVRKERERLAEGQQLAQQLVAGGRFQDASLVLSKICRSDKVLFAEEVEQAEQMLAEAKKNLAHVSTTAEKLLADAGQALSDNLFDKAKKLLLLVPEAGRDSNWETLDQQVSGRLDEMASLKREIESSVRAKHYDRLLPSVNRLLAMRPGDGQCLTLAKKLQLHLIQRAEQALLEQSYSQAVEYLTRVPVEDRTDVARRVLTRAKELMWLDDQLCTASLLDTRLRLILKRLQKLDPQNTRLEPARRRIQQADSANGQGAERLTAGPEWTPAPKSRDLWVSVDWLTGLNRMKLSATARPAWQRHRGQFFVAAGLALQAVGLSDINTNLIVVDNQGWLPALPSLKVGRKKPPVTGWGIDVGSSGLKLVKASVDPESETFTIDECIKVEFEKSSDVVADVVSREQLVEDGIEQIKEQLALQKEDRVAVSVPASQVLGKWLGLPPAKPKKLKEVLSSEVRHQIPIPIDDLVWDYKPPEAEQDDQRMQQYYVLAAKKAEITSRIFPFQHAGLPISIVQSESAALHNFLMYDHKDRLAGGDHPVLAILDVGAAGSRLVVSGESTIWYRTIAFGGERVSRQLVEKLGITHSQAEQVKRDFSQVRWISQLFDVAQPELDALAAEIKRSISSFANAHSDCPLHQIFCSGAGMEFHGILQSLRSGDITR